MRKISYLFALLVSFVAFSACTSDVDNYFDESAPDRASNMVAEVKDVLYSAPNGWRMEYYGNATYGGYNVLCKFAGDSVAMAAEKAGGTHEAGFDEAGNLITAVSHFSLDQSMGVVISFDSYNKLFHYFSDPKNDDYGEAGYGFEGDFEFRVLSYSPERVVLQGRKHNSRVVMYPMSNDQTWEDYLRKVEETKTWMASSSYTLMGDKIDREVNVQQYGDYHCLIFQYLDNDSASQAIAYPYVATPEGYQFYDTVSVEMTEGKIKFNNLAKGDTDERFYPAGDNTIWLETVVPSVNKAFENGQWFFSYSQVGEYAQSAWDEFKEALKTAGSNGKEATLYWAQIGTYNDKFGFHAQAGSDYLYVQLKLVSPNEEGNEVAIQYSTGSPTNKAAQIFIRDYKLDKVLKTFSAVNSRHRVKLVTDNPRKPTYMKVIDAKEENNVLNLSASSVSYPFEH